MVWTPQRLLTNQMSMPLLPMCSMAKKVPQAKKCPNLIMSQRAKTERQSVINLLNLVYVEPKILKDVEDFAVDAYHQFMKEKKSGDDERDKAAAAGAEPAAKKQKTGSKTKRGTQEPSLKDIKDIEQKQSHTILHSRPMERHGEGTTPFRSQGAVRR